MKKPCTYILIILTALLAACSDHRSESASTELTQAEEAFSESDYASAMNIAASALDFPQTDSIVFARLYDIIARCHRSAGNHQAELSYAQQAAELAPNDSLVRQELVISAINAGQHDLAMKQLERMDSTDEFRIHMLPLPAMKTGQTDLAREALVHLYSNNLWMDISQMAMLAEIYYSDGMHDRASAIIEGIDPSQLSDPEDLEAMVKYYDLTGNAQMAMVTVRKLASVLESRLAEASSQEIYSRLYEIEHSARTERQIHDRNRIVVLSLCVVLLLLAAGMVTWWLLYRHSSERRRLLQKQNDLLMLSIERRRAMSDLFSERNRSIELMGNLMIDASVSDKGAIKRISSTLSDEIERFRSTEVIEEIARTVNECFDNIITRLEKDVPTLSHAERILLLYSAAGLSARVICLLTSQTPAAVYAQKHRIRKKIQSSEASASEQQQYLDLL
ncbi:MAG: hypothetical protein K2L11_10525 [Muribaculaceae bacterium]|nr:hypothetical protein [Muribaculaceae bacterium]